MRYFAFGNKKLPKTTMIFNISSAFDCEGYRKKLCQIPKRCYARKAERIYPAVLPYRERQKKFWLSTTPTKFVGQLIKEKGRRGIDALRFNESGDFITQNCIVKAVKISNLLINYNISTYCYTTRRDLDFSLSRPNLVVNGSGFMADNQFSIYSKLRIQKYTGFKCVQDCRKCSVCLYKKKLRIAVELH